MESFNRSLVGLSPFVRFAAYPERGNWRVGRRILRDYLLFYVECGKGLLTLEGQKFPLETGGWYWVPPGRENTLEGWAPPRMKVPYIHFDIIYRKLYADLPMTPEGFLNKKDPAIQPDIFKNAPFKMYGRVHPKLFGEARDLLFRIINLFSRQPRFFRIETSGLLLKLIVNILEGQSLAPDSNVVSSAIAKVEQALEQQFRENLSLNKLSELVGYHPAYLARLFKNQRGLSPRQYLRRLKINHAKDLLRHSNFTLTAIAEECGFSSLALFSRTFHQLEGISPTEYLEGKEKK